MDDVERKFDKKDLRKVSSIDMEVAAPKLEYAELARTDTVEEDLSKKSKSGRPWIPQDIPLRDQIYQILSDPSTCRLAGYYSIVMIVVVLSSVASLCFETIPTGTIVPRKVWEWIDLLTTAFLSAEYVVRFATCPDYRYKKFFLSLPNIIDLLSVIPFYVELASLGSEIDGYGLIRVSPPL
jgi:hypothetical protein